MRTRSIAIALATVVIGAQAQHGPYAGQQARDIKALSEQEVRMLRDGLGSGFAKAAELNGYPGPMHVLELAPALGLTTTQQASTQRLLAEHKARARELGAQILEAERSLDRLFAQADATPARVEQAAAAVAALQGRLRAEHLNTHLAQTAVLDRPQIARYMQLRGYATHPHGDTAESPPHNRHH